MIELKSGIEIEVDDDSTLNYLTLIVKVLTMFISQATPSCQSFQNIGIQLIQRAVDQVALMSSLVTNFVMYLL